MNVSQPQQYGLTGFNPQMFAGMPQNLAGLQGMQQKLGQRLADRSTSKKGKDAEADDRQLQEKLAAQKRQLEEQIQKKQDFVQQEFRKESEAISGRLDDQKSQIDTLNAQSQSVRMEMQNVFNQFTQKLNELNTTLDENGEKLN